MYIHEVEGTIIQSGSVLVALGFVLAVLSPSACVLQSLLVLPADKSLSSFLICFAHLLLTGFNP